MKPNRLSGDWKEPLDVRAAGGTMHDTVGIAYTGWWHILHGIAMDSGHRLCLVTVPARWPLAEHHGSRVR